MLSIIIPTFNRGDSLKLTLDSLVKQEFPVNKFEVLIVDNGSTDNTKIVSENFISSHQHHNIRYIYEPVPGLLSGRHRGAVESKGDILVYIDDDIDADSHWLEAIENSFSDPAVQLVGGRNLPKYESEPPEWLEWFWQKHSRGKYCSYLSLLDFGEQVFEIDPNFVWGLNFSIRKEKLFELGGFHPDCISQNLQCFQGDGETGLTIKIKKLKYKTIYQPQALIFHRISAARMTYDYFDKRFYYQGVCDSYSEIRAKGNNWLKFRLKNLLISWKNDFKALLKVVSFKELTTDNISNQTESKLTEKQILEERFKKAYQAGFCFHQDAVLKNRKIFMWVVKDNYWDYKLPELN